MAMIALEASIAAVKEYRYCVLDACFAYGLWSTSRYWRCCSPRSAEGIVARTSVQVGRSERTDVICSL